MISVDTAKQLIAKHVQPLQPQQLPLSNAVGLTIADDVYSPGNFPPFCQSGMDGYAFAFEKWDVKTLPIKGEVQAGAKKPIIPTSTAAVRIFTGAPLPAGLDTVVMQEKTQVQGDVLTITDAGLYKGMNVRKPGSEIEQGALALKAGTYLSPAAVGFLAGIGVAEVSVMPLPSISVLVTGKELQTPPHPLSYGQVYESNSFALKSALAQVGIQNVVSSIVDDDVDLLTQTIQQQLQTHDLVLLTGGVSVGDYDFVTKALHNAGAEVIFHKIKQRPGKPLLFAKIGNSIIFGLPGNPSSVLTCFYQYVLPAIQYMLARPVPFIKTVMMPMADTYTKTAKLTQFLKGCYQNGEVLPLAAQESYRMASFATANCLIKLNEEDLKIEKGDLVEVYILY